LLGAANLAKTAAMANRCALLGSLLTLAACASPRGPTVTRAPAPPVAPGGPVTTREILARYAQAWRGSAEMRLDQPVKVALWVEGKGGGNYHLTLSQAASPRLEDGEGAGYDIGYRLGADLLRRIDRGEVSAMTAIAQEHVGAAAPLQAVVAPAFESRPRARSTFLQIGFHFWNREWPEVTSFGAGLTRQLHGANGLPLFYDEGFRSAWLQLNPSMHINEDPHTQRDPWQSLFIVTRGRVHARLDGQDRLLQEGQAVIVPPGMSHEFWTDREQYAEMVLLMFGTDA
jgi:mannose-6-phosphate isomerase-like protein (cupin superfamily)